MPSLMIRRGEVEDAPVIVDFIRRMLEEMAQSGGYQVNESRLVWSDMLTLVQANCAVSQEYLYLLACPEGPAGSPLGLAAVQIAQPFMVFAPTARLHLSAIYVLPAARRQGIASQLIQSALDWGQERNVVEADLNVLVDNPARRLYEQLGFRPHEVSMTRPLKEESPLVPLEKGGGGDS